jgi:hypothetical protein
MIEATAETPRAAKAWTAPYSTVQSRPSTASMPGSRAGVIATRVAPVVDERAYGMESGSVSCAASTMLMVFFALKASVSSNPPRKLMMVADSVEANSVAQSQSEAYPGTPMHVFAHCCASAKLIMKRRNMMRASRGAAPKRPTALRRVFFMIWEENFPRISRIPT